MMLPLYSQTLCMLETAMEAKVLKVNDGEGQVISHLQETCCRERQQTS